MRRMCAGIAVALALTTVPGRAQQGATPPGAIPQVPTRDANGDTQVRDTKGDTKYKVPRTPWGDPDLQGKWPGIELVGVPMQRPASFGTRNVLTDQEFKERQERAAQQAERDVAEFDLEAAAKTPGGDVGGPVSPPPHWLERGTPQRIASLIVDPPDGRIPPLTEAARRRSRAAQSARKQSRRGPADSYTDRSLYDRCITRGIAGSFLPVIYNNGNQIVQGPGWVALMNEMIHETRIVPLDARGAVGKEITTWMGLSRGRWEGDTLVVETTNFNDRTSGIGVNGGGSRHTMTMKVTERIRRVADDMLVWEMTFDDRNTWTRPWTIQLPLKRDDDYGMYEYACHEGNYSMFNILSGARADDKAAADAAAAGQPAPAR
jgi:hypothetical protein